AGSPFPDRPACPPYSYGPLTFRPHMAPLPSVLIWPPYLPYSSSPLTSRTGAFLLLPDPDSFRNRWFGRGSLASAGCRPIYPPDRRSDHAGARQMDRRMAVRAAVARERRDALSPMESKRRV